MRRCAEIKIIFEDVVMKSVFAPIARFLIPLALYAGTVVPAHAEMSALPEMSAHAGMSNGVAAADPASVAAALKAAGHDAVLTHDDSGDPLIRASIGGWASQIVFYDCNEITHAGCQSLQFSASFMPEKPFDAAAAAAFVRDNRFGAVTVGPDRAINVTWDVITGRGIDPSVFALVVKSYRLALDTIGSEVFTPAHRPHLASATR
jgi:hypothetical protein